tara:strand:- start:702 stop:1313 length:612 start_codon:yes stop_codon:yes gene_type:complete
MIRRNLIVVDDFLQNPDAVREYALVQQFEFFGGKNWPGRDSSDIHGAEEMTEACSHVVGEKLTIKPQNKCSYFRLTKEGQDGRQHIHFDPNPGLIWAGVLYLTPIVHPTGGTKFWKHKETGWDRSPTPEEGAKYGVHSHQDMVKFFDIEGKDESKWIELDNVAFKYNRLVMFNPSLWHSNGDLFGTMEEDARLVQLFFFHGAD